MRAIDRLTFDPPLKCRPSRFLGHTRTHPESRAARELRASPSADRQVLRIGDGSVPIDNNVSEREMKRIVLNRKNSLFVGNERGGATAAILSSLTSTCRRHGVNPQLYLTQLLTNLPE